MTKLNPETDNNDNPFTCNLDNPDLPFTLGFTRFCSDAAAYALALNEHTSGVCILVQGSADCSLKIEWTFTIDKTYESTFEDHDRAAEYGAYLISFFQIMHLTDFKIQSSSRKGGGFDFWLVSKEDTLNYKGRLEVSGLTQGSSHEFNRRVKEKIAQIGKSNESNLPGFVSVTNFSQPISKFQEITP